MLLQRKLQVKRMVLLLLVSCSALSNPPGYDRAWKAVTSGGGPSVPEKGLKELSPEQREKEWAARIIEQHQRAVKAQEIKSVVDKVAEKLAQPNDSRAMFLDLFDGGLGKMKLTLRSPTEAMLTATGEFRASKSSNEPGVVVLNGADVECVVDTKRCSHLDFVKRDAPDWYAISAKRPDDTSFLTILLGGDAPPTAAAVSGWLRLRDKYDGVSFVAGTAATRQSTPVLRPEGGLDAPRPPPVSAGPLRPQGGVQGGGAASKPATRALDTGPLRPSASTDGVPPKRPFRVVKPAVLIPRIDIDEDPSSEDEYEDVPPSPPAPIPPASSDDQIPPPPQ